MKLLQALGLSSALVICLSGEIVFAAPTTAPVVMQSMCDASAVLKINSLFLVLDDEDQENTYFRLFDFSRGGQPILAPVLPLKKLQIDSADAEIDFEGLAQVDSDYFAIGSHSRTKHKKPSDSRKNLIAFRWKSGEKKLIQVLGSLTSLIPALQAKLGATAGVGIAQIDPAKDPKQEDGGGGLSIEGISALPNGNLLIGLRSPTNPSADARMARQAIAVELLNPLKSVTSNQANLGNVYLWQLNGAGIRDLAYDASRRRVLILSGPPGSGGPFKIWTWNGSSAQPIEVRDLTSYDPIAKILAADVAPEGLTIDGDRLWVVFDEGRRQVSGMECKDLPASNPQKTFRAVSIPYNF